MLDSNKKIKWAINKGKKILLGTAVIMSFLWGNVAQAHKFLEEVLTEANIGSSSVFTVVANYNLTKEDVLQIVTEKQPVDYYLEASTKSHCDAKLGCITQFKAVQRLKEDSCESSGSKTCGQFDHFTMARSAAIITCHALGEEHPELYPNGLIPMYNGPSTFVDLGAASDDHHLNYNLDHGLNFNCGYLTWVLKHKLETK